MLKIDLNHNSPTGIAEEVLQQLGITASIPLLVNYLTAIFAAIEDEVRPKEDYWELKEKLIDLQHDFDFQGQRLRVSEETCQQLRNDKEALRQELVPFKLLATK